MRRKLDREEVPIDFDRLRTDLEVAIDKLTRKMDDEAIDIAHDVHNQIIGHLADLAAIAPSEESRELAHRALREAHYGIEVMLRQLATVGRNRVNSDRMN